MEGVNRLELSDEDIIIISNVDEIPKPKSLRELREEPTIKEARVFKQMAFYYNFSHYESNCRGSMIIPFSLLRKRPPQFFKTRRPTLKSVSNGGWHCLFFGSSESVLDRIQTSPWYPAYKVTVGFDTGTANEGKDTGLPTSKDTVEERILLYQDVLGRRDRSLKDLRRVSHEDLPENKDLLYGNV